MRIKFNLDGTTSAYEGPSEQESLQDQLFVYERDKESIERDFRTYRNFLLSQSDWTVFNDSPLNIDQQNSWKEYRQQLRDLPANPNAPDRFLESEWPLSPNETEVSEEAKSFIEFYHDPVGLGTTSWVGLSTTGEYFAQERPQFSAVLSIGSTVISGGETLDITLTTQNNFMDEIVQYNIIGISPDEITSDNSVGNIVAKKAPRNILGISTVSVSFASTITTEQFIVEIPQYNQSEVVSVFTN